MISRVYLKLYLSSDESRSVTEHHTHSRRGLGRDKKES